MKLSLCFSVIVALLGFMSFNLSPLHGANAATEPAVKKIPFHGKLKSVDATAQSITIAGKTKDRVFFLTPETRITDGSGAASTLAAAVIGEDVGGSYTKDATGKMTLGSVRLGAKTGAKAAAAAAAPVAATPPTPTPAPAVTPAPAAPASPTATANPPPALPLQEALNPPKRVPYSGKVVSVDAAANTLVIHFRGKDMPFTVTATTKFTGADNLAAITAGTHVSGMYSRGPDGHTRLIETFQVGK
jgi:hypothetical protein